MMNDEKLTAEELANSIPADELDDIVDDLDDFDLAENKITYEIVLIGNDKNDLATDFVAILDDGYTEEAEAKLCYDYCTNIENLKDKLISDGIVVPEQVKHLYLRLNMLVDDGEIYADILEECEVNFK